MTLMIAKFHEEKSCRVSPYVATNFYEQTTSRIQLVASCVTAFKGQLKIIAVVFNFSNCTLLCKDKLR